MTVAVVNDGAADELVPFAYLPLVFAPGQPGPSPTSPYAAALSQALADCAGTTLNQVCYAAGSALVNTAAGDGAVLQAHQLSVPLDGDGNAAGAPTPPTVVDDDLLEPLVPSDEDDPLADLLVDLNDSLEEFLAKFESAFDRCVQGDSRQVYRVMYYARILKKHEAHYPDGLMELIDTQVMQCATFEIEFNSVISGTSTVAWGSMYVQGQGMIVSYDMDGRLVQPAEMPLTHLRYDFGLSPL